MRSLGNISRENTNKITYDKICVLCCKTDSSVSGSDFQWYPNDRDRRNYRTLRFLSPDGGQIIRCTKIISDDFNDKRLADTLSRKIQENPSIERKNRKNTGTLKNICVLELMAECCHKTMYFIDTHCITCCCYGRGTKGRGALWLESS